MAPVKVSFAIQMPNVAEVHPKVADSARAEMAGREMEDHALVRLNNVYRRKTFMDRKKKLK